MARMFAPLCILKTVQESEKTYPNGRPNATISLIVEANVKRRRTCLTIERLESRMALAGNITAIMVGDDLVITGDEQGNDLIFSTPSLGSTYDWALSGNDTTINGIDTSQEPVPFSGVIGNVVIRTGAGDDRLSVNGFLPMLTIQKALIVDMGLGSDAAHLFGGQIRNQVVVQLGDGHDTFSATHYGVSADMIVRGGLGNDSIKVLLSSSRDLAIDAGEGFDHVRVESSQLRNSTLLDGGAEGDRLEIFNSDLPNDSAIFGGEGGDAIFASLARPQKTLLINGGAGFAYIEVRQSLLGTSTYIINEGPTQIDIDGSQLKRLEVFTSPMGDSVSITRCSVDELFASLGESSDAFKLIANRVNQRGRIDGQGGFDVFTQGDNVLTNLEVVGFEFFPPPQSFTQS
jgi:hypothetical protein